MTAHPNRRLVRTFTALALAAALPFAAHSSACASDAPPAAAEVATLPAFDAMPTGSSEELQKLLAPLAAAHVSGGFEERRTVPGFPKPMVTTGVFEVTGQRLLWRAEKPFPSVMTVGPEGVVIESGGEKQMLASADVPAAGRIAELLTGVLSGRFDALTALFDVRARRSGDGVCAAAKPRAAELAQYVGEIRAAGRTHVERIELLSPQGDRTEILFSGVSARR
ncbi:outer membrane lipoprotein carrier protein LolA [Sutterella sp.]|uniref:outer membrane lipoprotein carrier protein LolA n=1 Tax=Sutterella sp. TaxID=1981025 RepID=UPI003FD82D14